MKSLVSLAALAVAGAMLAGGAAAQDKPEIAFVVNGPSDFWKIMEAAVAKAQTELPDVTLSFKYPERADAAVQRRMMDDLVAAGVDAIAVSVVDPADLDRRDQHGRGARSRSSPSTRDATQSNRVAYIGSSNVQLGKHGRRADEDGDGRQGGQVHGLRRPARRRQRQGAHPGLQRQR